MTAPRHYSSGQRSLAVGPGRKKGRRVAEGGPAIDRGGTRQVHARPGPSPDGPGGAPHPGPGADRRAHATC